VPPASSAELPGRNGIARHEPPRSSLAAPVRSGGPPQPAGRSGTQRAHRLRSRTTVATSAPWSSSPSSELRITRVFSCVARGLKARASFMSAGGCRWRSLAVDGSSGASRGHAPVVRRPGSRWVGAFERPSAFQAGHIPSWRESCESHALSPVADDSGWLLLLLSPLLSAVGPIPHFRGLPADDSVTPWSSSPSPGLLPATRPRSVLAQAPPPNPIAAEPCGRRVLSGGGEADHEVTPQAPLTGSGCREYFYGGFGGGHPISTRMPLPPVTRGLRAWLGRCRNRPRLSGAPVDQRRRI
jgi:hypothetical protein